MEGSSDPIVAPRSPGDCFEAALEATHIALTYRTPVLLLSDGAIANGSEPWLIPNVEDLPDNVTRFVWLARADAVSDPGEDAKTSIVFWGGGDQSPGWLVDLLGELASRGVNLTRIESRPRRTGLGHYMFFADLEGAASAPPVSEALEALARHVEELRVLGSYARPLWLN